MAVGPDTARAISTESRNLVEQLASDLGFKALRVADVGPTPHSDAFDAWLASSHHGEMGWMERNRDVRADPRARNACHGVGPSCARVDSGRSPLRGDCTAESETTPVIGDANHRAIDAPRGRDLPQRPL